MDFSRLSVFLGMLLGSWRFQILLSSCFFAECICLLELISAVLKSVFLNKSVE